MFNASLAGEDPQQDEVGKVDDGTTKGRGILSGITKGAGITKSGASATTDNKDGAGKHRSGD